MNYKCDEVFQLPTTNTSDSDVLKVDDNGFRETEVKCNEMTTTNSQLEIPAEETVKIERNNNNCPKDPSTSCESLTKDTNKNCAVFQCEERNKQMAELEHYQDPKEKTKDITMPHTITSSSSSSSRKGEEETHASDTILNERWSPLGANCDDSVSVDASELASGGESESELQSYQSDQTLDRSLRDKYVKLIMNDLSLESSDFQLEVDNGGQETNEPHEERLKSLEEEHEFLTSSLMALTSHFAHVQLRVRQIVEAPHQQRDELLKDLEEFAFREIPDVSAVITTAPKRGSNVIQLDPDKNDGGDVVDAASSASGNDHDEAATLLLHQRQSELIHYLKSQLIELEKLAYESGAPVLPQHILLEKQKIIIDELKRRLNFNVDDNKLPELSSEELKVQVDHALGEFVGPLKMKEQLVAQLKTQITDLERFIAFLQCDTDENKLNTLTAGKSLNEAYNSYAIKQRKDSQNYDLRTLNNCNDTTAGNKSITGKSKKQKGNIPHQTKGGEKMTENVCDHKSLHTKAHGLMDKASIILQMFATTQFGNGNQQFQRNILKRSHKGNHWGDLRAQLEVDVQEVASLAATLACDREKLAKRQQLALEKPEPDAVVAYQVDFHDQQDAKEKLYSPARGENGQKHLQSSKRVFQRTRFQGDSIDVLRKELTMAVRKNFTNTLARLMQHGLEAPNVNDTIANNLMVPFMRCLHPIEVSNRSFKDASYTKLPDSSAYFEENLEEGEDRFKVHCIHAWHVILEYYHLKRGDEYNNTPARKLSQSFNLNLIDSRHITVKQNLLASVGAIIATHRPYKRSPSAHFKAFVCAGLNSHQLVEWLNLIFNCNELIEMYYSTNSYVARTGFRDALRTINTLTKYDFELPVDFAIQHFRHL